MFNFKRIIALGVVSTMVLGSSLTAFATDLVSGTASTEVTGDGVNEGGSVLTDVYKVQVPTDAAIKATIWYTIDKVGWIKNTNAAAYASEMAANFTIDDSSNLMFKNLDSEGKVVGMSNTSDALKIKNVGTLPVALEISGALVAGSDPVTTGATKIDEVAADKALYLEMFTNAKTETTLSTTAAKIETAGKSSQPLYKIEYDSSNSKYKYEIPAADADKVSTVDVYFRGAFSKDGATTTDTSGTITAKDAHGIKVSFKATQPANTVKSAYTVWEDAKLWVGLSETDGFAKEKAVSGIKIDGKTASGFTSLKTDSDGWITLNWEDIYKGYGFTEEPADWVPQVLEFTVDSANYIADIAE